MAAARTVPAAPPPPSSTTSGRPPSMPLIRMIDEDGPTEILLPASGAAWAKLKLRNKCNRLILFRVQFEGDDKRRFRLQPTELGVLSPYDTQPFEITVPGVNDLNAKRGFVIETAFVEEKCANIAAAPCPTQPPKVKPKQPQQAKNSILDGREMWKSVQKDQIRQQTVPIRFDQSMAPPDEDRGSVYVNVIDPKESVWFMDFKLWQIYGFARSQFPEEMDKLLWYIVILAGLCFAVGFFVGMKIG